MVERYRALIAERTQVLDAFQYPNYRSYWFGTLAAVGGFSIMLVGQAWLIFHLTGSPLYLGYLGLVSAIPYIASSLIGGVIADKVNQRRLILISLAIAAPLMFLLATLTLLEWVRVWHVLTISFCISALQAVRQPAQQSLYPHLLDRKVLVNAVALHSSIWQGSRVVAPAIGGIIISHVGNYAPFYVAFLGFVTMALMLYPINVSPPKRTVVGSIAQDMMEGITFIRKHSVFSFLIGMTFFTSFFGLAYTQLMPVFAEDILNAGPSGLGFLLSASGIGALLGSIVIASMARSWPKGMLVIGGATLFGVSLVGFALSESFLVSMVILFLVGLFNSVYMIVSMSTLQELVPDQLRGRVMGIYGVSWSMVPLGGMQIGAMAHLMSASFAVALGGVAVAAFALAVGSANSHIRRLGGPA